MFCAFFLAISLWVFVESNEDPLDLLRAHEESFHRLAESVKRSRTVQCHIENFGLGDFAKHESHKDVRPAPPRSNDSVTILFPKENFVFREGSHRFMRLSISKVVKDREAEERLGRILAISYNGTIVARWPVFENSAFDKLNIAMGHVKEGACTLCVRVMVEDPLKKSEHSDEDVPSCTAFFVDSNSKYDDGEESVLTQCASPPESLCGDRDACSHHGTCVKGVCRCIGDWYGPTCANSWHLHSQFLPDLDPVENINVTCAQSQWWRQNIGSALGLITATQDPLQCENVVRIVNPEQRVQGFGAHVHFYHLALMAASRRFEHLLLPKDNVYYGASHCGNRGHGCYFEPISHCDDAAAKEMKSSEAIVEYDFDVPVEFEDRGIFWWRAVGFNFLLRPNINLQTRIAAAKAAIGFRSPIVGLHVRHGDACLEKNWESRHCSDIGLYLREADRMLKRYKVPKLFLATDNEAVISVFQKAMGERVIFLNFDRSVFSVNMTYNDLMHNQLTSLSLLSESVFVDLFLLAHSDYLITSFSSQLGRLAMALSASHHGFIVPHISVDDTWFANDAIRQLIDRGLTAQLAREVMEAARWDFVAAKAYVDESLKS